MSDQEGTVPQFPGFPLDLLRSGNLLSSTIWINACAQMESLAELQTTQYIAHHSYLGRVQLTVDEFMHGKKDGKGERIDQGTGLSERAVRYGLQAATKHGYIKAESASSGKAIKTYQIRTQEGVQTLPVPDERVQDLHPESERWVQDLHPANSADDSTNAPVESDDSQRVQSLHPAVSSNSNLLSVRDITKEKESRIRRDLGWLDEEVEKLSKDLGDERHVAQNKSQARTLFVESKLSREAFERLLESTKAYVLGKSGIRNRMSYFFECIRRKVKEQQTDVYDQLVKTHSADQPAEVSTKDDQFIDPLIEEICEQWDGLDRLGECQAWAKKIYDVAQETDEGQFQQALQETTQAMHDMTIEEVYNQGCNSYLDYYFWHLCLVLGIHDVPLETVEIIQEREAIGI